MRVVALSGERLVTPFDGLSPDSRYEWKKVSARTTPGKCQGQTQSSKLERLLISLGLETVAYAQCTSCPAGGCMGQNYCYDYLICDPCYGTVDWPDSECGSINTGYKLDGSGCLSCCGALCNSPLCDNRT
jgi:hypothetical protein